MPRKITAAIKKALEKAWLAGSITLSGVCPHCFKCMDYMDHGKCSHCKRYCGCSFNPVSSSDHCDFHRRA